MTFLSLDRVCIYVGDVFRHPVSVEANTNVAEIFFTCCVILHLEIGNAVIPPSHHLGPSRFSSVYTSRQVGEFFIRQSRRGRGGIDKCVLMGDMQGDGERRGYGVSTYGRRR